MGLQDFSENDEQEEQAEDSEQVEDVEQGSEAEWGCECRTKRSSAYSGCQFKHDERSCGFDSHCRWVSSGGGGGGYHGGGFRDLGRGCCTGSVTHAPVYQGNVGSTAQCKQKCSSMHNCQYAVSGWAGSSWCTLYGHGNCGRLAHGPNDCGSTGDNGVHSYKRTR